MIETGKIVMILRSYFIKYAVGIRNRSYENLNVYFWKIRGLLTMLTWPK